MSINITAEQISAANEGAAKPTRDLLAGMQGVRVGQEPPSPLSAVPGFPFVYPGANAHVSGPTGSGKSAVVQACAHDAALAGIRVLYVSFEVDKSEFDARATKVAIARGDHQRPEALALIERNLRFFDGYALIPPVYEARAGAWVESLLTHEIGLVIVDPASAACSCVGLDDESNPDWMKWRGRVIDPLRAAEIASVVLDNIGHDKNQSGRPKGASQKGNAADVTLSSKRSNEAGDPGLVITCTKTRSMRAPFKRGDSWVAYAEGASGPVTTRTSDTAAIITAAEAVCANEGKALGTDALRDRLRAAPHRISASTTIIRNTLAEGAADPARALQHDKRRGYSVHTADPAQASGQAPRSDPLPQPCAVSRPAEAGTTKFPHEHREIDPAPTSTPAGAGMGSGTLPQQGVSRGHPAGGAPSTDGPKPRTNGPFDPWTDGDRT